MEEYAKGKAGEAIRKLIDLQPQTATEAKRSPGKSPGGKGQSRNSHNTGNKNRRNFIDHFLYAIRKLIDLQQQTATLLKDGREVTISIDDIEEPPAAKTTGVVSAN
jgi:cation transport ATPase